jgi:hypothetical protein
MLSLFKDPIVGGICLILFFARVRVRKSVKEFIESGIASILFLDKLSDCRLFRLSTQSGILLS